LADIQPPSLELRTAIIRKKAETLPTPLDGETVDYLASALKENIRQIEGVIKKIAAVSMISSTPITKAMCERIVKEFTTGTLPPAMLVDSIFETVSKTWNIPVEEIKGKKQKKEIAMARHVSIYLISSMTDYSLDDIGILFGKDHSTVHYSINKIKEEMEKDREFESKLNDMIAQIRS
jgi:chromosomal replication initiator protein